MAEQKKSTGSGYYASQALVTARHKAAGLARRKRKLDFWLAKGVKKNGKKVLTLEERKIRAASRRANKPARKQAFSNERQYSNRRRKSFRKIGTHNTEEAD